MSIITRKGDDGMTDVMYGARVSKNAPEIVACGAVDELNSCLGMVRVTNIPTDTIKRIDEVQDKLVALMGLLSVPADKRSKYLADGYPTVGPEDIDHLEAIAAAIDVDISGWARPGSSGDASAAWMDMARSICRRAELAAWALGENVPVAACQYLNRLSDILWLWARELEQRG